MKTLVFCIQGAMLTSKKQSLLNPLYNVYEVKL